MQDSCCSYIRKECLKFLESSSRKSDGNNNSNDEKELPMIKLNGKIYIMLPLNATKRPAEWVSHLQNELEILKSKTLAPLNDITVNEIFKTKCGYKEAARCKASLSRALLTSSRQCILSLFTSLARKCHNFRKLVSSPNNKNNDSNDEIENYLTIDKNTKIGSTDGEEYKEYKVITNNSIKSYGAKIDASKMKNSDNDRNGEEGDNISIIEEVAINNFVYLMSAIFEMGCEISEKINGHTLLHLSCACGSHETTRFLINRRMMTSSRDEFGWLPIHHSSFSDYVLITRCIIHSSQLGQTEHFESDMSLDDDAANDMNILDARTNDNNQYTSIMLCAVSGALETFKLLKTFGADLGLLDCHQNGIVELSVYNLKFDMVKYYLESGVNRLISLLQNFGITNFKVKELIASVLLNLCKSDNVKKLISDIPTSADAIVKLFSSDDDFTKWRTCQLINHLLELMMTSLVEAGCIILLASQLRTSSTNDVLLNTLLTTQLLCYNCSNNQEKMMEEGMVEMVMELMRRNDFEMIFSAFELDVNIFIDEVKLSAIQTLRSMANNNEKTKMYIMMLHENKHVEITRLQHF
ncbi:hypothetical protein HELRODRAFT_177539 [Helobdella robusta]|uniref:Uncharacterized protein n=1 Tax=Helobdella robusta TaxID=6412 RepID=T1FBU8_HELRO|nr:hypothetical protein HELRODRAFT_177539 [Helobdella robusta]ESN97889.1 hypothetical protein HELRODRAFT_177539 [Helobdella robusta]